MWALDVSRHGSFLRAERRKLRNSIYFKPFFSSTQALPKASLLGKEGCYEIYQPCAELELFTQTNEKWPDNE